MLAQFHVQTREKKKKPFEDHARCTPQVKDRKEKEIKLLLTGRTFFTITPQDKDRKEKEIKLHVLLTGRTLFTIIDRKEKEIKLLLTGRTFFTIRFN
jgi:cupin superfamily acireductone dioxygenase involved in methionine salvage